MNEPDLAISPDHSPGMRQTARGSWRVFRVPILWWLFISIVTLTFSPNGWALLRERSGLYYDAGNYTTIAVSGYVSEGLAAFYPLWPAMMRLLFKITGDAVVMGWAASILAALLFGVSLAQFYLLSERWGLTKYRGLVGAVMVLSPLSLFRVLPFTESLFSVLLLMFIWDLTEEAHKSRVARCALWAFALSLTRPMFPFLMVASLLLCVFTLILPPASKVDRTVTLTRLAAVFLAAPIGYIPYGLYCKDIFGNFWMPFSIQAQWGRKLGLHWDLIFSPKVINGSNEVLVWDLIGFYGPLALLVWGLWFFLRRCERTPFFVKIGFLMAVLIGCAHVAAAFLTHHRFMSVGRHVLANPLPYLGLLIALQYVPVKHDLWTRRTLGFVVFASAIFLGMWWFRFTKDQWIG